MPSTVQSDIIFWRGTYSNYLSIPEKNADTLYFAADGGNAYLYRGSVLMGTTSAERLKFDADETFDTLYIPKGTYLDDAVGLIVDYVKKGISGIDLSAYSTLDYVNDKFAIIDGSIGIIDSSLADLDVSTIEAAIDELKSIDIDELKRIAAGIDTALQDYYKVDPMDSSALFPLQGDSSTFYIDKSANSLYRYDSNDGYLQLAGGSNSSFTGNVITEFSTTTTVYVPSATDATVKYSVSSAYQFVSQDKEFTYVQTGDACTVRCYVNGSIYKSDDAVPLAAITAGTYTSSFTIPYSLLTLSSNAVELQMTDIKGNPQSASIAVNVVTASISSSYAPAPIEISSGKVTLPFFYTVNCTSTTNVYYSFDNAPRTLFATKQSTSSDTYTFVFSDVSHGMHNLTLTGETQVPGGGSITANSLSYNIICHETGNTAPILASSISLLPDAHGMYSISQYDYATVTYQAYPVGTTIDLAVNGTTYRTLVTTSTNAATWTYTFADSGSYPISLTATYGGKSVANEYQFAVAKRDMATAVEGASVFFTAEGHGNKDLDHAKWDASIGGITAGLSGFAWEDGASGWNTVGNTTSLKVSNGARCTIPYSPFKTDYSSAGRTIEFDFSTSDLKNSDATVISCYSQAEGTGVTIKANEINLETSEYKGAHKISSPFNENERVRVSIVFTPSGQDDEGNPSRIVRLWDGSGYADVDTVASGYWKFVKFYINGTCSMTTTYTSAASILNDATISIGSDDAAVDVYCIRIYDKVLYDSDIVNNYIADTQDVSKKFSLYERNNIMMGSANLNPITLNTKIPCLYITCESDTTIKGFANSGNILPVSKDDKRGYKVIYNCDNLSEDAKSSNFPFATSFVALNAQMCVQGTSSQWYPRKNYKLTFKPYGSGKTITEETYDKFCTDAATGKPTVLFPNTIGSNYTFNKVSGLENSAYAKKYVLRSWGSAAGTSLEKMNSISATKFCLKADFAESSGCHNTGTAKFVDYVLKSMTTVDEKFLTPPQIAQLAASASDMKKVNIRTTVDGYPIAVFWRQFHTDPYQFLGKYNFNFDKGAEAVFGFVDITAYANPFLSAAGYADASANFQTFNDSLFASSTPTSQEIDARNEYEPPVECWEFLDNSSELCNFKEVTDSTFTTDSSLDSKGNAIAAWTNSFENRHPDNDYLAEAYTAPAGENIHKVPERWQAFCKWVCSTDVAGWHRPNTKELLIPTKWNGTLVELQAGAIIDTTTYEFYGGTYEEFSADTAIVKTDISIVYVLQPQDATYQYYNRLVRYSSADKAWNLTDEVYSPSSAATIDSTRAYYIESDPVSSSKVYVYSGMKWVDYGHTLSEYALGTTYSYEGVNYDYDTAEYRLAKFANELHLHMNLPMTFAYYIFTEFLGAVDQRAKNMMFATWGYEDFLSAEACAAGTVTNRPVYDYKKDQSGNWAKTVKCYAAQDAEYIYYPIFYDNDTVLGINNEGELQFDPNIESGDSNVFNGERSVLWRNLAEAFPDRISETYEKMTKYGLDLETINHYYNETQCDMWAESLYNMDGKFKYVDPATVGYVDYSLSTAGLYSVRTATYLYERQGSRLQHRNWWLANRFTYMDSRYNISRYSNDYVTLRMYNPANAPIAPDYSFVIKPYSDMYIRIKMGSLDLYKRAKRNTEYTLTAGSTKFNDTETYIYGSGNLLSIDTSTNGRLAYKYPGLFEMSKAIKLTDLRLGQGTVDGVAYVNAMLKNVTLPSSSSILETIDLRGSSSLSTIGNLNSVKTLKEFRASNTSMSSFAFASGAALTYIEYPAALTQVRLQSLPYIQRAGIKFEGYSNISMFLLEDCPYLAPQSFELLYTIMSAQASAGSEKLKYLRVNGVDWTIMPGNFQTWSKLLTMTGISSDAQSTTVAPYINGSVTINGTYVSTGYKAAIESYVAKSGATLTVSIQDGYTTSLNGIAISGDEVIPVGGTVKYYISYSPDDYVEDSAKGAVWDLSGIGLDATKDSDSSTNGWNFAYVKASGETNALKDYIYVGYTGQTDGSKSYSISAKSSTNQSFTASKTIRPSATLTAIRVYKDSTYDTELTSLEIYEGEVGYAYLKFYNGSTEMKEAVPLTVTQNGSATLELVNTATTHYLKVTANAVASDTTYKITLTATNVTSVHKTFDFVDKNIVTRNIYFKNELNEPLNGASINIVGYKTGGKYVALDNVTIISVNGKVSISSKDGYVYSDADILVQPVTGDIDSHYGVPLTSPSLDIYDGTEVAVDKTTYVLLQAGLADNAHTFWYYKPVTLSIDIRNGDSTIDDKTFRISSAMNEANGYADYISKDTSTGKCQFKVLTGYNDTLKVVEIPSGEDSSIYTEKLFPIYTDYSDASVAIQMSRDYMKNIDDNKFHMTVVTGNAESYTTLRMYIQSSSAAVISWGDSSISSYTPTGGMDAIYHTYPSAGKEYDIVFSSGENNVSWFHCINDTATHMEPCFGTYSGGVFEAKADWSYGGGIVAYQSIGTMKISTMPRFNMESADYKKHSVLYTVGNIYKNCSAATTADALFRYTGLVQISDTLFTNCTELKSFRYTFAGSNIIETPKTIFYNCTKAVDFTGTFNNCTYLQTLNTSAQNTEYVNTADGIEITSMTDMFSGCIALTGSVPEFWKYYYGCSFSVSTNAFGGCTKAYNYKQVPASWGGYSYTPEYYESALLSLKYFTGSISVAGTPEITISEGVFTSGTSFVYDCAYSLGNKYEMYPLLGISESFASTADDGDIATSTPAGTVVYDVALVAKSPSGYNSTGDKFLGMKEFATAGITTLSTDKSAWTTADEQVNDYDGKRISLDIFHTSPDYIYITPYGSTESREIHITRVKNGGAFPDKITSLALMSFYEYKPNCGGDGFYDRDSAGNIMTGSFNGVGKSIMFYELKIYDSASTLKYDFVPKFGVTSADLAAGTTNTNVIIYDSVTKVQESHPNSKDKLKYYRDKKFSY